MIMQKINALKLKVKEADMVITDAERGLQAATRSTSEEVRRFHRNSVHDMKGLLLDYVTSQVWPLAPNPFVAAHRAICPSQ